MVTFVWSLAIIVGAVALAYNRASVVVWTIAAGIGLVFISSFSPFHAATVTLLWLVYLVLAVTLNASPWRRDYLSKPLFAIYKKLMPSMSETEREAIDAGTVKWAKELFCGSPNWHDMLKKPAAHMSAEEIAFLNGPVEELCKMLDDWDITHNHVDLPPKVWKFLKENKFFAMIIPKEYGGLGFSATANSNVIVKIAATSVTTATTVCVPNSLGPAELLYKYGTQTQKDHYLPRLADGREIPCFALTGPMAGSDATSIPDSGVICKRMIDGKEVIGAVLNFKKRYITLAPIATVIGLAFKMYDPEQILGEQTSLGITCALLPRDTDGITIGRRHFPLNTPFQNGPIVGEDVFMPLDWIIGGAENIGRGWTMLVECLSVGRGISLPAMGVGGAKIGIRAGGAYCRMREQFGLAVGKFEGVSEVLTRAIGNTYVMDSAREMTTSAIDNGEKPAVLTAIAKAHITERSRKVANDIMDIHGGKGICLGPRNYLGRSYQSVPVSITVEGANILTRSMIIFGQGAIRCHPFVFEEMHAALEPNSAKALARFDKAFFGHLGHVFDNTLRSICLALTSSRVVMAPKGAAKRYFQHFTRISSAFGFLADLSMAVVGADLKRKESLSGRLGDILSLLYLGSAVLKRFHQDGCPKQDEPLMHWACQDILADIQQAFDGVLLNFPNRWVAGFARCVIFPLGQHFHRPSDQLGKQVAKLFLEPSETRDRLTKGICLDPTAIYPGGRIDQALKLCLAVEPIEMRVKQAVKNGQITGFDYEQQLSAALSAQLITEQEYEQILQAHEARMDIIHVDDFETRDLQRKPVTPSRKKAEVKAE